MKFNNGDQTPAYGNENPAEGGNVIIQPKDILLSELPAGSLFSYKGTIALKSEYRTDEGAIQAYIVGTGEMFWGGTDSINDLAALIVTPMPEIIEYSPSPVQGITKEGWNEELTGEVIDMTGFTQSNRNHIKIEILGQENYIGNNIRLHDEIVFRKNESSQSQTEQKTLAEFLKSNPEALKEALDMWDSGSQFGLDPFDTATKQQYFSEKFGLTIN